MNNEELIEFVEKRKREVEKLDWFWEHFEKLHDFAKFNDETYQHVKVKVSSRYAFLQRSIRDHEKLIK